MFTRILSPVQEMEYQLRGEPYFGPAYQDIERKPSYKPKATTKKPPKLKTENKE